MTRFHRAFVALILLSGCGPRDARYDVSHFVATGVGAPPEIALPAHIEAGARFGGIETIDPSSSTFCCTAFAQVDVPVRKDGAADTLVVGTYVASDGPDQHLRVTFPDGQAHDAVAGRGFSTTVFALPVGLRARRGPVRVRIHATNVPYTLTSLYFE